MLLNDHECYQLIWHTISCAVPDSSVSGTYEEAIFQPYCGLCNFLNVLAPLHCRCYSCLSFHDWHLQNANSCCSWAERSLVASCGLSLRCQLLCTIALILGLQLLLHHCLSWLLTVPVPSSITPSNLQNQCLLVTLVVPSSAASIRHILGHL